jgi:hypothetical protein
MFAGSSTSAAAAAAAAVVQVPVCLSQCLAHMLFMVANGDQMPTALADTLSTVQAVHVHAYTLSQYEC